MLTRLLYPRTPLALLRAAITCDLLALTLRLLASHYQQQIYNHFDNTALGRLWLPISFAALCGLVFSIIALRRTPPHHSPFTRTLAASIVLASALLLLRTLLLDPTALRISAFSLITFS